MSLAAGQRLGPYEITAPLGAGGMGEVWRARDTRLGRDVAIKVLPAGLAQDEQFLKRFEREARVISSLSHPHICTLFDVGEEAQLHYLVMEYLEGEALADRLQKGPFPLHDVLKYGQQIASALHAAHRQGITHRDLKPGNVMLTKSGAKLLDFGLAKTAAEGGAKADGHTSLATEAKPLTEQGTILGTFQYMSPEQLEGQEADARTDIFALGAVLYEMATGRRAFEGKTKTSLIAAIVKEQPPPIAETQPLTPPALQRVDTHRNPTFLPDGKHFLYCAAPANASVAVGSLRAGSVDGEFDRKVLDYASSVAFVNGWLLSVRDRNLVAQRFDPSQFAVMGKPVAIAQGIDWYPGRYVGTFAAGAETLVYQRAARPSRQLLRLDPGDAQPVAVDDEAFIANPAVSADGRQAIVNRFDASSNSSDLWRVDLGGGTSARLTFGARGMMEDTALFSPDGQRVALTELDAGGVTRSWIQPTGGGTKDGLLPDSDTDSTLLSDWSRDGKTLLTSPQRRETGQDVEILRLDGDRRPVPLVHGPSNEGYGRFSPNGKWVAYQSEESGRSEVYVTSYPAATAKWQVSTGGGALPAWSADGRQLYYLAGDRVVAAAVNDSASFSASAARPVEALGDRIVDFNASASGRIVAVREIDPGKPPLTLVRNWQQLLGEK